jgi:hypothetical protein
LALSLLLILGIGTLTSIAQTDKPRILFYRYGYPPWWHDEGYPIWWHDFENCNLGYNLGFPHAVQILSLPSLTPQQRQQLNTIWEPTHKEMVLALQRQNQLKVALQAKGIKPPAGDYMVSGDISKLSYDQRQYLCLSANLSQQLYKLRYRQWLAAKPILTQTQLIELKDMAIKSGPQDIPPLKIRY